MRTRHYATIGLVMATVLAALMMPAASPAGQKTTLSHNASLESPWQKASVRFADLVNSKTAGKFGVVALLWSADPSLVGDIERTEQIIIETARPYTGSTSLGCIEGGIPNAAYGYGIVDVYAAVKEALGK